MTLEEWLEFFKKNTDKKLFTLSDMVTMTDEKKSTISVQLSRLVASGILERPVRGWYSNPFNPPDNEEIAMIIRHPSYLSMEYALSRHGVLSQNVFTYTLVTTKLPYTYLTDRGVFEYHQVKRSLFWGFTSENQIQIADPEKAFLDLIYIRARGEAGKDSRTINSLVEDMYFDEMNEERLISYANRYGSNVVLKVRKYLDLQ